MGILTFTVNLVTTKDGLILVLWQSDGMRSLSPFGEQVRDEVKEIIQEQLDMGAWQDYYDTTVPEGKVVQLGTVSVDDTKSIVDDAYFTQPTDDVAVHNHPLEF